jgi:TPP-dependent pyruvate/acetoin dehydrogenase alpha subunit
LVRSLQALVLSFSHLSTGQEAVAVGIEHAITKEDNVPSRVSWGNEQVITAYRCHGFTYMRGGRIKAIIAELLGRRDGVAFGKGTLAEDVRVAYVQVAVCTCSSKDFSGETAL